MTIEDIYSLKNDITTLRKNEIKYNQNTPNCLQFEYGFNKSRHDEHSLTGGHLISLDGYSIGHHPDYYLQTIENKNKFWKYFDMYLNEYRQEIATYISDKFSKEIEVNIDTINNQIKVLQELKEDIQRK